jgi:hypothetical protein
MDVPVVGVDKSTIIVVIKLPRAVAEGLITVGVYVSLITGLGTQASELGGLKALAFIVVYWVSTIGVEVRKRELESPGIELFKV